jgi:hypothetical protein
MRPRRQRLKRTFFSSQSHLLPIRILLTPSEACCSMLACHVRMSVIAVLGVRGKARVGRTVKAALVRHVVDKEDAHGAAVVGGGDGPEALLAGRVPDLQFDFARTP